MGRTLETKTSVGPQKAHRRGLGSCLGRDEGGKDSWKEEDLS